MNKIVIFLLIIYLEEILSNCETQKTCRECIRDPTVCVWCASKAYNNEQRCKPKNFNNATSWCPDSLAIPEGQVTETKNDTFSSDPNNIIQINPQKYHISLRPGELKNFSFTFKWADDYPVDLYFLLDSSFTMRIVRNQTSQQSENIYNTMKNLTKNVHMGMGTFVDKNMLPYTLHVTDKKAYSFKHRLSMTQNYKEFQKAVDVIPHGENRDLPEAGLDALAQAIACKDTIGWRDQSRKILILMTDDMYHAAGDGKSAGVFQPYDGKCYTKDNVYTKELELDYPSVSMINKMARDNDVIIIFAVPDRKIKIYDYLSEYVTGSKTISLDAKKGKDDDIATKLKQIYEEITRKLKLNINMQTDSNRRVHQKNYDIKFYPDCTKDISDCNVTRNEFKDITGTIMLLEYDGFNKSTIDIKMEGVADKLTLDIDIINDCQCSKEAELNSDYCHNEIRECGICQCNEPKYGDKCQCDRSIMKADNDTSTCIASNTTNICSGRGICSCGKCSCQPEYVGPYCECSLYDCPMDKNGRVCGNGDCLCSKTCKCPQGWTGPACECGIEQEKNCMDNHKICNNRGNCNCGKCNCFPIATWDRREVQDTLCKIESCSHCHNLQCATLMDCALCLLAKDNINSCNCSFVKDNLNYIIVDKLPENVYDSEEEDWHVCKKVRLDMGCYTNFTYKYEEDSYRISVMLQKERNCAENFYIFGAIFLLCAILVGLFTLLGWKLITYLRDRNEYLQFMKHHVPDSAPCRNPLYEPATTQFRNPAFEERPKTK